MFTDLTFSVIPLDRSLGIHPFNLLRKSIRRDHQWKFGVHSLSEHTQYLIPYQDSITQRAIFDVFTRILQPAVSEHDHR